jgi:glycosyltransferase involved in cell wall biosynthesis
MDLSVVIATRDRATSLAHTLPHLARQTGLDGVKWEVVVVINGSDEDTESVLCAARTDLPVRWVRESRPGKSVALNRAINAVNGELIVITDDDVIPEPGWLAALLAAADRWPEHAIFGGSIEPLFPPNTPTWIRNHRHCDMWFSRFVPSWPEGPMVPEELPYPPNLALRARVVRSARFNETVGPMPGEYPLGCELELMQRLVAAGERAVYVPSARLQHVVREDQIDRQWLLRRCFQAGRGLVRWFWTSDTTSTQLLGRPWRLWRAMAGGWVRRGLSLLQPAQRRFDRACELRVVLGQVHEYDRMMLQRRVDPESGL